MLDTFAETILTPNMILAEQKIFLASIRNTSGFGALAMQRNLRFLTLPDLCKSWFRFERSHNPPEYIGSSSECPKLSGNMHLPGVESLKWAAYFIRKL